MEGSGKLYYGIQEVAVMLSINASKLRYYEKNFLRSSLKNRSGDRVYTQADIDHLTEILDLIDKRKFTLPGAREYLKERNTNRRNNARIVSKLTELKAFLEQMRSSLD